MRHRFFPWRRVILSILLLGGLAVAAKFFAWPQAREVVLQALEAAGWPGFLLFTVGYNIPIIPFPYDVFVWGIVNTLPAQAGPLLGAVVVGTLLAAAVDYALARRLQPRAQRWFGGRKGYHQCMALLGRYGVVGVAATAVTPVPFSLMCWVCGVAKVPFWRFMAVVLCTRCVRHALVWAWAAGIIL